MSGGSYDYLYTKIEDVADSLLSRKGEAPIRRAFAEHLKLVAKALHDIEWVDSGDYGGGDDVDAIRAALGPSADAAELKVLIDDADRAREAPRRSPRRSIRQAGCCEACWREVMDRCALTRKLPRTPCCLYFGSGYFLFGKGLCTFVYYQKSSRAPHGRCAGFGVCKQPAGRSFTSEEDLRAMEDIAF